MTSVGPMSLRSLTLMLFDQQRLAVQLADDERLGEVLRAERQLAARRPAAGPTPACPPRRRRRPPRAARARAAASANAAVPARPHQRSPPPTRMSMRSGSRRAAQPPTTVISSRPSSSDAVTLLRSVPSGRLIVRRKAAVLALAHVVGRVLLVGRAGALAEDRQRIVLVARCPLRRARRRPARSG